MRRFIALAVMIVLAAAPAAAQDACGRYVRAPEIGGWSSYQLVTREKVEGGMRFAIVGREERDGRAMHRFEMTMRNGAGEEQMTMQVLVPGWPYDGGAIEEMIMQPAGKPPMLVAGPMLAMMKSQAAKSDGMSAARRCADMEYLGQETVTVPGGTFRAAHYRDAESGTEVWASDGVPFGLVKSLSPKGEGMVLTGHGEDATTALTGTPQPMGG